MAKPHSTKFLAEVLGKVPEDKRAAAKALLEDPALDGVVDFIGDGTLRQSDYSTRMNELQTATQANDQFRASLDAWYAERQAALAEADRIKAAGGVVVPPVGTPAPAAPAAPVKLPDNVVTTDHFERTLDQVERGAVSFFSQLNVISIRHLQQFGEVLDTDTLLKDPRLAKGAKLEDVYKDVHKDKLQAKADEARLAGENAIRADERAKVQAELAQRVNPSYVGPSAEPSSLDLLEAARRGGGTTTPPVPASVEQMAAEFTRLQQQRLGAG